MARRLTRKNAKGLTKAATSIREVTHGNKLLYLAIEDEATESYGTPIKQIGMRAFDKSVSQSNTDLYADDQIHIQVRGTATIETTLTSYQLEDQVWEDIVGYKKNVGGAFTDSGSAKNYAAYYVETIKQASKELYKLNVIYSIASTIPTLTSASDEDSVEGKEYELPGTAKTSSFVKDDDGNAVATMFVVFPEGTTLSQIEALMEASVPLPTDDFTVIGGTTIPATGTLTAGTPTTTSIPFTYDYTKNDDLASESKIQITTSIDTTSIIDTISNLTEGSATSGEFTGLTTATEYIVTMLQGSTELDSFTVTTL